MIRTISQKMGVKENSRAVFVNAQKEALENINLPTLKIQEKMEEELDYIHLFVNTQTEFITYFPKLKTTFKTKRNAMGFLAKRWEIRN